MCSQHPGLSVKVYVKLLSEVGALVDHRTPVSCDQRLKYCNQADSFPTLKLHGEKKTKEIILLIFFIASSLPLSISWCWWLWHLFHLDFKTIWFIFLVQHIPSLSQKIRQYVTKCTFYSVINLTEFLFVTKGAVDIHQLLLLHHEDLALEYSQQNCVCGTHLRFQSHRGWFLDLEVICHKSGLLPSLF